MLFDPTARVAFSNAIQRRTHLSADSVYLVAAGTAVSLIDQRALYRIIRSVIKSRGVVRVQLEQEGRERI